MKKSKSKLFFLCLICGIVFTLVGVYLSSRSAEFKKNGIAVQAKIVDIEKYNDSKGKEEISVYVIYSVQNTSYTKKLDYYSDGLREGDTITILYLPDDPNTITYSKFNTVPQTLFFIGGGVCVVFAVSDLIAILIDKKQSSNANE